MPRTSPAIRRRLAALREGIRTQLWPAPVAAIVVAIALGVVLPTVDVAVDDHLPAALRSVLFSGGTDAARAVLSAISGSLISATSLTFSLTVVALQLATSQATPRLLRLFARDRVVQGTLALFLGTFAFALGVLRTVQDASGGRAEEIPRISVSVAIVLTLASVVQLTLFLAHLARQLRVETMLAQVHGETDDTIDLVAGDPDRPDPGHPDPPADARWVQAEHSGFLVYLDRARLIDAADDAGVVIESVREVGSSVVAPSPLARWWTVDGSPGPRGDEIERLERTIRAAHRTGLERTSSQDVAFGIRQLVDIAAKALSPGINDPTTAVHALGHLSAVLCRIVRATPPAAALTGDDGTVRLLVRTQSFEELLDTAVTQPRRYGAGDPAVLTRIARLLREVAYADAEARERAAIDGQLRRLERTLESSDLDPAERDGVADEIAAAERALDGRWG